MGQVSTPKMTRKRVTVYSREGAPELVWLDPDGARRRRRFVTRWKGRIKDETRWQMFVFLPEGEPLRFFLQWPDGRRFHPSHDEFFGSRAPAVWVQDEQVFDYAPAPSPSAPRVEKIDAFSGRLPSRPLYVYLPRGYDQHLERRYPVIYMHDGQNCFESFVQDSFSGSWRADQVADRIIAEGKMQECIIVGVANGEAARIQEYLPPYATFEMEVPVKAPEEAPEGPEFIEATEPSEASEAAEVRDAVDALGSNEAVTPSEVLEAGPVSKAAVGSAQALAGVARDALDAAEEALGIAEEAIDAVEEDKATKSTVSVEVELPSPGADQIPPGAITARRDLGVGLSQNEADEPTDDVEGEDAKDAPALTERLAIVGEADRTVAYYVEDVEPYIASHYRTLPGRENRCVCGSSMGGLFSLFFGWEHGDFVHKIAALSTSFWVTAQEGQEPLAIERLRDPVRREMKLWLDSGTGNQHGDDGMRDTMKARAVLIEQGYAEGKDFLYFLDRGAIHHESSWAGRLHLVFAFLFPACHK